MAVEEEFRHEPCCYTAQLGFTLLWNLWKHNIEVHTGTPKLAKGRRFLHLVQCLEENLVQWWSSWIQDGNRCILVLANISFISVSLARPQAEDEPCVPVSAGQVLMAGSAWPFPFALCALVSPGCAQLWSAPCASSLSTVRASEGPIYKGVCKCFCRSKGHGFITPADGGPDIFVHISEWVLAAALLCLPYPTLLTFQTQDWFITRHPYPSKKGLCRCYWQQ